MKISRISIATATGTIDVDAEVHGPYAVHVALGETMRPLPYWHVTHVPTGLAIPYRLTREAARALALCLAHDERTADGKDLRALATVAKAVRNGFHMREDKTRPEDSGRVAEVLAEWKP